MRIALYVPSWPSGSTPNGIVTYASQLVPALRQLGHEVFILTPRKNKDDDDAYTIDLARFGSVHPFWYRLAYKVCPDVTAFNRAAAAIKSAIKQLHAVQGVEVFEIEESFGWSFAISRLNLLPVVVRLHGPWFLVGRFDNLNRKDTFNGRQEREGRAIRRADVVTAPSDFVLQSVKDHYNTELAASRVIPNPLRTGAEWETWRLAACRRGSILFVGRFDFLKGGDLILRAFGELAPSYPDLRLTFVGPDRGIQGPDREMWSFERFVRNVIPVECQERIEFRGQIDQSDVLSERRRHFATIIASRYETASYTALEAMSLGCPIVASAVGGNREFIKSYRNGLLVPPDAVAIAEACRKLLDDPEFAASLGRQAWLDCRDLHNPSSIAQQTIAAYQEAIDAFRSRSKRGGPSF